MDPTNHPAKSRALLLDLDGTIADTLPLIFDAFRHAIAPWVKGTPSNAEIEARFGPPERGCLARMVPRARLDEAESLYHAYYESKFASTVKVFDGMTETIDRARTLGWRVGVFTGKGRRSAEFTLVKLGLRDRVEHLVSGDDVARTKPDPDGVLQAARALNVPLERILLVGDSPLDIQAGREAGARTAAALWAAFLPDRVRKLGADFVCKTVGELVEAIERLALED